MRTYLLSNAVLQSSPSDEPKSFVQEISHPLFKEKEFVNVYSKTKCRFLDIKLDNSRPHRENELPFDKHFCIAKKTSNINNI